MILCLSNDQYRGEVKTGKGTAILKEKRMSSTGKVVFSEHSNKCNREIPEKSQEQKFN